MKTKKLILFAPYNLMAHYLRCIQAAKLLRDEFDIVFLFSEQFGKYVEENNFRQTNRNNIAYENVISKTQEFDFSWINYKSVSEVVKDLVTTIKLYKPDLVFGDTYLGLSIACSITETKLAVFTNSYITKYYAGYRPVPHNHRAMKYRSRVSPEMWIKIVKSVEKFTLYNVHRPFRLIRLKHRLKPHFDLFDEFTGNLNFLCDDDKIFPLNDLPDNYFCTGPVMFRSDKNEDHILSVLNLMPKKPVIFVSSGSSGYNIVPDIIPESALVNYNVIVSGFSDDLLKSNMIYRKFVNFSKIAERIDLVICHAGNGTMYQAIEAGKKIIAIPSMFEQEWNAYAFNKLQKCSIIYPEEPLDFFIKEINRLINENLEIKPLRYEVPDLFVNKLRSLVNSKS
ncbi:MAG: glycosyltransferase [Bacteroidales bacterium]|nr:glycosyltransferase [Bacteroidales bacterium]